MTAKDNPEIVMVLDNLRSIHNVGAILRTANGFGVHSFIFVGTSPYPKIQNDPRPLFMADKQTHQLHKTALGAEEHIVGQYFTSCEAYIRHLQDVEATIVAIEQSDKSVNLADYTKTSSNKPLHIILGNEVTGVSNDLLEVAETILEIPMQSTKESFNVEATAAMVLYKLHS